MKTLFPWLIWILLAVLDVFGANVQLGWTAPDDPTVAGYRIYVSTNQSDTNYWKVVDAGAVLTCLVSNVPCGMTNYCFATAYNAEGLESDPSNTITWRFPLGPMAFNYRQVKVLSWLESANCLEGPWSMMALLQEMTIPTDESAEFFRLRGQIERGP